MLLLGCKLQVLYKLTGSKAWLGMFFLFFTIFYLLLFASSTRIYPASACSVSGRGGGMDSKSIRNHRSVSKDESQRRLAFSCKAFQKAKGNLITFARGVGGRGGLDECLLSQDVLSDRPWNDKEPFRQFIIVSPSFHTWGFEKYQ
jgi:hypothetical protein